MKTQLIFFSPTGTTEKIVKSIGKGMKADTETYDLTPSGSSIELMVRDGVTVVGVPVYAGRVPLICAERLSGLKSDGAPAVAVVLYGNREYEDALVELRDMLTDAGFRVIAGAAFVGEHSYSSDTKPIAKNRPDGEDCAKAEEFGRSIADKLSSSESSTPHMDGNVPYKERMGAKGVTPKTVLELCVACGTCAKKCPTNVITISDFAVSSPDGCIMCCACVKSCPKGARYIDNPVLLERVDMLHKNFAKRKEPIIFI